MLTESALVIQEPFGQPVGENVGLVGPSTPACIDPLGTRGRGTFVSLCDYRCAGKTEEVSMNGLIYLVGLVVVVLAVLSFFGLR
jgi:hypothetical protein